MMFNFKTFVILFVVLLIGLVQVQEARGHMVESRKEDVKIRAAAARIRAYNRRDSTTSTSSAAPAATPSTLTQRPQANAFNFNLTDSLPRASTKYNVLDNVPDFCQSAASPTGECKATMTAINVTFDDCGTPFTICRCSDAQMSIDIAVDRFARVPTGLRRYVANVYVMGDTATHAYTLTNGDIHFFGDCQMETWIHESTHAYDFASGQAISRSQEWNDAIQSDSCVPDNYAQTNPTEDFAQMAVIKIYSLARSQLPPGFDTTCMQNQLDFMGNLPLFDEQTLFGNTCDIPDTDGFTGARKIKAPVNLNQTKVFPIPDAPPVDFPSVSASIEAKLNPSATAEPSPESTDTDSSDGAPPAPPAGGVNNNGRVSSHKFLPDSNSATSLLLGGPPNIRGLALASVVFGLVLGMV